MHHIGNKHASNQKHPIAFVIFAFGMALCTTGQSQDSPNSVVSTSVVSAHAVRQRRWQPTSLKARRKLDAAERLLSRSIPGPPMGGKVAADWIGAENDFEAAKEPLLESMAIEPSGRACRDLGRYCLRSSDYEGAVRHLNAALEIRPTLAQVRADLAQAHDVVRIQVRLKRYLPHAQEAAKLFRFPAPGRRFWTVFSSERNSIAPPNPATHAENALISVFEEWGRHLSLVWRSPILASIQHRQYSDISLWAFPMTAGRVPELVFMGICRGGSAAPTRMLIYRWTGRTFRQVLDTESGEQPLWIEDLRHDSRYQVRCVELVGNLSHSAQVRWPSIYDWNGSLFAEADVKFPSAFRKTKAEIQNRLRQHPDDPVLLKYLGKAYLYEGRRRQAVAAFRKMERVCLTLIKDDAADIDSWWNLGEIARITGRPGSAVPYFHAVQRIGRALARKQSDVDDQEYYYRYVKDATRQIRTLRNER